MNNIFTQLAVILSLSSVLGLIIYKFKLPLLIAYLLGGLILGLISVDFSKSYALSILPDIGIAFVLFLVGMELDLREIRNFGKQILIAGVLQVVITSVVGTFIAQSFGFNLTQSIYLGVGLAFSSTILVVKLLSDKGSLSALFGKLSLGVLLLEDLLAVLILLVMTSAPLIQVGFSPGFPLIEFILKVVLLFGVAIVFQRFILSSVFKSVSDSTELLFLISLAWCFSYITLALSLGFSILIGAFLAGVALASSPYHFQIQGKVKPMRDFFVVLFFVYLGTRVNFADVATVWPLIFIFTSYAIIIKPLIFLLLFGMFGFRKHTMFFSSINLSQISEFSLIILLVGLKLGIVTETTLTVIALSSILSYIVSSLEISYAAKIYKYLQSIISFFEKKTNLLERGETTELSEHIVVIGAHRVGGEVVRFLKKEKKPLVVLDFNPRQVEALLATQIPVIYGDLGDPEVLDILELQRARMVISTSGDVLDNKVLLEELKTRHINIPVIVRAHSVKDAKELYKKGADFVILPEVMAGDSLMELIRDHLGDRDYFKDRARIELEKLSRKPLAWE